MDDNYNIEINSNQDKYNKRYENENQLQPTLDEPISTSIKKDQKLFQKILIY